MPRKCTICSHPQIEAINRALVENESFRYVAKQFGISSTALHRHKSEHIPAELAMAKQAEKVTKADDLLSQVRGLQTRALYILQRAEEAGDLRTAVMAIREARGNLELLARLLGELQEGATVNLLVASPEWLQLRTLLLAALEAYPEARRSVVEVLMRGKYVD